jgi:medium-chain acyl-[acyl-carrier-protein] hydrolase
MVLSKCFKSAQPVQMSAITTLVIFPHAGASANAYNWALEMLPHSVQGMIVEYPGHGSRLGEPLCGDIKGLAKEVAAACCDIPGDLVFFGHSMGSLVGFEAAKILASGPRGGPRVLIASGHAGPFSPPRPPFLHELDKNELLSKLWVCGGMDEDMLRNEALFNFLMPILQSDASACYNYSRQIHEPVDLNLVAYGGRDDPDVSEDDLLTWFDAVSAGKSFRMFEGSHFYFAKQPDKFIDCLISDISVSA